MSRLIKKPVAIEEGASVTIDEGMLRVKGPKGEITLPFPSEVAIEVEGNNLWVKAGSKVDDTAIHGTIWALARNAIEGVTKGFEKILEIEGVGYRAVLEGKELVLFLGYALPVRMAIPDHVTVAVEKNTIKISGINKEEVGQVAAEIRAFKKPEPYKGKGIHYRGEVIRRKVGKKAGATGS
ncbi:MAG: 50S ribosomal protein L6 [Candidatus Pacebacteria bacterium]|nr:50S ribosomal protein L6 [Candidatus Paceibacterota bacterium]